MSTQTRNILQTVQEREVIKQAPDVVIYIDGQVALVNPYLGTSGQVVTFNDYFNSFTAGYDIDSFKPSASVTFAVPTALDYLFRSPGGNNLLQTMSEIRVFMKGYYLSKNGNSVYYQVFRGYISSISYAPDGKQTQISLQCAGAMGLLERMQIDLAPGAISSSAAEKTMYTSIWSNLNPYAIMGKIFVYPALTDGFELYSLQTQQMNAANPYYNAVNDGMRHWQALLYDIARDVHIFGPPVVYTSPSDAAATTKWSDTHGSQQQDDKAESYKKQGTVSQSQDAQDNSDYYAQIREYLPDMSFGSIQLFNGRVVNRLEHLMRIVNMVGFEGYTDIDGSIIIKPPLYNLDVTEVVDAKKPVNGPGSELIQTYANNNPFIVQLSEIISEQESEDEAGVRATRMTARGSWLPGFQAVSSDNFTAVAEDIDISKLRQFGLRAEPPHSAFWVKDSDHRALYGFAVSELARANRGFRTYSVTIPVRPELKLGFPVYFPHKDIYAYVKSVNINHTQGSDATMTLTMDSIRRRPMFPEEQDVPITPTDSGTDTASSLSRGVTNVPTQKVVLLTPQTNLVLRWTKGPATGDTGKAATAPTAALAGQYMTVPVPIQDVFKEQAQLLDYRRNRINNSTEVNSDTTAHCWRVQPDTDGVFTIPRNLSSPKTEAESTKANDYFLALRSVRPYTDGKGYELVGPFPWGRWKSLQETAYTFTVSNRISDPALASSTQSTDVGQEQLSAAQALLFLGSVPTGGTDAATRTLAATQSFASTITSVKSFELTFDESGAASLPSSTSSMMTHATSQSLAGSAALVADEFTRAEAFLNSCPVSPDSVTAVINANPSSGSISTGNTSL